MDNYQSAQRRPIGITSSSAQDNQGGQGPRGYSPMQERTERSTSAGAFSTRESDAHENDAFGFGPMGGDGRYTRESSSSLRQSPSDTFFHTGWDTHNRGQSIGRTPSAGSSHPSADYAIPTQPGYIIPGESTGGEYTPLSRPYSTHQSSRVSPIQYRGTHHPSQPTQGPRDLSPYTESSDPFLWSSRRNDGVPQGDYQSLHTPQPRTGRLGGQFHPQGLETTRPSIDQIVSEITRISSQVRSLENEDRTKTSTMEQILNRLDTIEKRLSSLGDGVADVGAIRERRSGGTSRGGSNHHLSLKPVVHSMFYEMCGVEMSGNKTQRTQELCAVKPLGNGAPFEVVNDREIWHPVWDARVDHSVNAQFLKAVVERIWDNEKSLRDTKAKGELDDQDFSMPVIGDCAKIYFRNVHKQSNLLNKPEKLEKTRDKGRSRGRRQARTKIRRLAAERYCPEMGIPLNEAMAALDTDYASEAYTCSSGDDESSSEPGEDQDDRRKGWMTTRREKAGLGATAKMVVGPVWRNPDYTAFARWLTFKHYKGKEPGNTSELTSEPPRKRRRTTTDIWKGFKKEFDPPPGNLSNRLPSTKGMPFKRMMADWWLRDHPDFKTLESGGEWLAGFRDRLGKDDLHPLDWDHLDELGAWHMEKETEAQHDSQFVVGSSAQVM